MTQLGDELLVAYTDGELTTVQRDAIARVLSNDPVASQRIKSLKGAHQRLHAAFDQMLADYDASMSGIHLRRHRGEGADGEQNPVSSSSLPDFMEPSAKDMLGEKLSSSMPDGQGAVQKTVPEAEHVQQQTMTSPHGAATLGHSVRTGHQKPEKRAGRAGFWILLVVMVLLLGMGAAAYYYGRAYLPVSEESPRPPSETARFAPVVVGDWKLAVLHHHTLTAFQKAATPPENADMESARIFVQYSLKINGFHVPDLKSHGLTFTGAKVLTHAGERIARLAFTGAAGRTVSLYVKAEAGQNAIEKHQLGEVNAIHWSQGGTGFVVTGKEPYWSLIVLSVDVKRQNGGAN